MFFSNNVKIKRVCLYACMQFLLVNVMHASAVSTAAVVNEAGAQEPSIFEIKDLFKKKAQVDFQAKGRSFCEELFQYAWNETFVRFPLPANHDLYAAEYKNFHDQNYEKLVIYKKCLQYHEYLASVQRKCGIPDSQEFLNYYEFMKQSNTYEPMRVVLDPAEICKIIVRRRFFDNYLEDIKSDQLETNPLRLEYASLVQKISESFSQIKQVMGVKKVDPVLLNYILQKERPRYQCTDQAFRSMVLTEYQKLLNYNNSSPAEQDRVLRKYLKASETSLDIIKAFPCVLPIVMKYTLCEATWADLVKEKMVETPTDLVYMLRYMDRVRLFDINNFGRGVDLTLRDFALLPERLHDGIITLFPENTLQLVEEIKRDKAARLLQEAHRESLKKEELAKQEQIAKELVRKNKMACRLEKQTHENLLRERFFTWMHDPQITINQKKQDLKDCFDAFCKAIDHKKLYKKMIFEQEVLKPNQEHALLVEASREQREAMPPVPEAVSIIKKDKLEQVVEQISHANTDSSQETTRLARIARRAHRAMQRNVLLGDARRKFNKYESDVMGTVEERNAKIALEQFNEQQKQKRIALQQEQAKPIISAFLYAADDAKKVAILRQKQQVRQETRRAALSGPDAWSHDPYKNHGIDLSFSNYSASIDGNDGLSDSFSSPVAVAAVTEKKDGTMDGNQSAHLHRTLGSDHYLAREFDDMNRDLKEIAAQSGRFFDFALQEVRSNFKK